MMNAYGKLQIAGQHQQMVSYKLKRLKNLGLLLGVLMAIVVSGLPDSGKAQSVEAAVQSCANHIAAGNVPGFIDCAYAKLPTGSADTCQLNELTQNIAWCLEKRNNAQRNGQAELIKSWRNGDGRGMRRSYLYCQGHQLKNALSPSNPFVIGVNCPESIYTEATTAASKSCPPCWN